MVSYNQCDKVSLVSPQKTKLLNGIMELTLALITDYINLKPFMYEQSIKPCLSLNDIFLADVLCHTAKAEHFLLSYL